jgi:hypothetical protein
LRPYLEKETFTKRDGGVQTPVSQKKKKKKKEKGKKRWKNGMMY